MSDELAIIETEQIKSRIFTIRGLQVMVDRDLAELYEVEAHGESLRFQFGTLNDNANLRNRVETSNADPLRSQFMTLEIGRGTHRKYLPYVSCIQ